MGSHLRETTAPYRMTREQLEALVSGLVDHRLAAVEERLSALERRTNGLPSSSGTRQIEAQAHD
jgi:hypothetical protein